MSEQNIIERFRSRARQYIAVGRLLHDKAPVVVALSGGADSVALLAVLRSLGYDCRAAHCNFHLRGEESRRDMNHARAIAERLDVDLYVRDFDVAAYREATGTSVEMACRDLRYRWFDDLLDREGAQAVAVGHHREDRAETFMLNLMRGTGIAGLTSMLPRSGNVVRPLLPFSRAEIEEYLRASGLVWIEDSSNASDEHRRNRLRNHIFPRLEELFPGAMDAVLRTVGNLEAARDLYSHAVEEAIAASTCPGGEIDLNVLRRGLRPETVLLEHLRPLGFTFSQVADIISGTSSTGALFHSTDGATVAEISRGMLHIYPAARLDRQALATTHVVNPSHDITSPVHISVSTHPVEHFVPENLGPDVAYIDAAALDGNPVWELRRYRRGDRMVPFGKTSSKLLSDIFVAARYNAAQKNAAWVLTRNGEIVWLPGLRNSAAWTVGPETKRYLRLYFSDSSNTNS